MDRRTVRFACLALALVGCAEPETSPPPAAPAEGGGMGLPPLAGLFASKLDEPGPYEAPRQSKGLGADDAALGVITWDGAVEEVGGVSWLGKPSTPVRTLVDQLQTAAEDPKLTGLLVRIGDVSVGAVAADELRRGLVAARAGGKPVWCHAETLDDARFHIATGCDRIGLAPQGTVSITGPAATPIHLKGLLDTLGITADVLHVGAFKGAAEPLTRDAPSPEMLETLGAIVEQRWTSQLDAIAQGRGLDSEGATAAVDKGLYSPDAAASAKLVDAVATWTEFRAQATPEGTWRSLRRGNTLGDFTQLQRFLGMLPPERPSGPHVALVYAVGNIVDGAGSGIVGARQEIASHTLIAALDAVADDDAVKAVVLRVDSGGGSALASEQIWHAAKALADRKPLVVSMGAAAASGGYYISAPAARIFAAPDTLTGSIGVVGGKIVLGDALGRIGVRTYEVHRGKRALLWSAMTPWSEDERVAVGDMMRSTYDAFVRRVSEGRKLEIPAVEAIAQGRVWTGTDAKAKGLVDELGTLRDAIADAETRGSVTPGTALEVYPPEPTLRDILTSVSSSGLGMVHAPLGAALVDEALGAVAIVDPRLRHQLGTIVSTVLALQGARVWTAAPTLFWTW